MKDRAHYLYYLDKKLRLVPGRTYLIGRDDSNDVVLPERTVSRKHARIGWERGQAVIEDTNSTNGVLINQKKSDHRVLIDSDTISVGMYSIVYRIFPGEQSEELQDFENIPPDTLIIEHKVAKILEHLDDPELIDKIFDLKHFINIIKNKLNVEANVDKLTGIYNRRFFDEQLQTEIERAKRYDRELNLIMLDVDNFKTVNDRFGHQKGDELLHCVASLIQRNTRINDIVARYGGEEIAIIMPEISKPRAHKAAEKIRKEVAEKTCNQTGLTVTVSLGLATLRESDNERERLIGNCDIALYAAKGLGKNRVEDFSESLAAKFSQRWLASGALD